MGIGVSIFLMAVGAILAFAVEMNSEGIDLNAVGVILMILGLVGLLASFALWNDWQPRRRVDVYDDRPDVVVRRRTVAYDEPAVERRTTRRRDVVYDDRVGPGG